MNDNILANLALQNLGLDVEDEQQREGWSIKDDGQADWALDKIREARADFRRFEMVVKEKVGQLQAALATEQQKMDREIGFFQGKLFEYFGTVESKETKTQKVYKLPSGRLMLKYKQPRFERNEEKLVEWLEKNNMPDLVKVSKSADWATIKKETDVVGEQVVSKNTGEVIEGVMALPQAPEFTVEV